ncbi:alpha/beta hydrolase [Saccharopolyspora gloriosae]|uniref:Pimeloyl-ACP methyl ester carboxylesterase n=1 Tax=Saccharopolyspora gloriosae TaxID=455344 RepID=A0A840NH20_9PSEU|nr:pimeloyl-ACP methyl ester carboxylesterase [Saccharopolyspora gloriosae]
MRTTSGIGFDVSGQGPPLVLHPGMYQLGEHWTRSGYTSRLTDGHTVITVDPLGVGSGAAPRDPAAYSLARRAESVTAVLDEVGADEAAFWGYSLGALTGYAVALHAPERLTCLVAGAFDPIGGFRTAMEPMLADLGLPADVDPYPVVESAAAASPVVAAVLDGSDRVALRANFDAFSAEPGVHAELADSDVPMLMHAGDADPWHDPMRNFAARTGTPFFTVPDADHVGCWRRPDDVLARVLPFLADQA